ncbi:hypothetical protein N9R53_02540 [Flavobacteriaceae bacterium]|jgi:hypothetical protein|nr:hypothetical protein [Flavobacteriaceae bacterium]MDC1052113.1 hypothetical protein [Flavobacteriaceae bacterium]MDC3242107.1 hypothetical protein [Flavobacteriaceae bacterium]MDG1378414.1 hypothetical protein [Flavobacteriaceae bacterium]MDG2349325.1 hypothetical protein [Flavobacteriaceae bacterium]|tara:strand:+ start:1814 stop:1963 length:150 start_codon:yes stop_codon:yes gene_type:complete
MAKLYTENFKCYETTKPSEETVKFLLNYSQALTVIDCSKNKLKFEALLN